MKARDTVMVEAQLLELGKWDRDSVLLAQAEITWAKAIKEVVEWIKHNLSDLEPTTTYMHIDPIEWQAKLKEWELREE